MMDHNEDENKASQRRFAGGALGFGTSFAVGMAVFSLGGHWLDGKFQKEPLFTLIGVFLGFIYGGWELWKLVAETNSSASEDERTLATGREKGPHESAE